MSNVSGFISQTITLVDSVNVWRLQVTIFSARRDRIFLSHDVVSEINVLGINEANESLFRYDQEIICLSIFKFILL